MDTATNVYVIQQSAAQKPNIRKITPFGESTILAGDPSTLGTNDGNGTNARFCSLNGIALDTSGNLFVSDAHSIRKITSNGDVITIAGNQALPGSNNGIGTNARFNNPKGIGVDLLGNIYVADSGNHTIRKILINGQVVNLAGNFTSGSDNGTGISASFNKPNDLTVDSSGNVYVSEYWNHDVRKITPSGVVTTLASFQWGKNKNSLLYGPGGIVVDNSGNVYVANIDTGKIVQKITPQGIVTSIVGIKNVYSNLDGIGTNASFKDISGLAIDASNNIYVSQFEGLVRMISPIKEFQSITFPSLPATTYFPGKILSLNAGASSALALNYSTTSSNVVINGSTLTVLGAGTSFIIASQGGNNMWLPAASVTNALVVGKASNPITFIQPNTKSYSNNATVYLAATAPGGSVSFTSENTNILIISGATGLIKAAGTVKVVASQMGNANYMPANNVFRNLVINKSPQSISFTQPSDLPYTEGFSFGLSATADGGEVVFSSSAPKIISINGTNATIKGIGTAIITATQSGNKNYLPAKPISYPITIHNLTLTSPDFSNGASIPKAFAFSLAGGQNIAPTLDISWVPPKTQSLFLLVHDPDAPNGFKSKLNTYNHDFIHWKAWNINPALQHIVKGSLPLGTVQGINGFGDNNYDGPFPPFGIHRYFFEIYALDTVLSNDPKIDPVAASQGHILSKASLMGTYRAQN